MSTAVHGPGDPGPQTPNPQAEVESDRLDAIIAGDAQEHAAREAAGEWPYGEEPEATVSEPLIPDEPVLFDRAPYRTPTPHFDDLASDKLLVLFGGGIEYDPTNPDHIEEFEALTLGRPVTITVAGYVQAKTGTYKETAEGAVTVTGKAQIKIDSILPKA